MTITRRGLLKALGIGAAAAIVEEPTRKLWFVGSNAPVGSRIERVDPGGIFNRYVARTFKLQLDLAEEELYDRRFDAAIDAAREQKRAMYAQMERDVHAVMIDELVPFTAEDYAALQKPRPLAAISSIETNALQGGTWRIATIEQAEAMADRFVAIVTPSPKSDHYWFTAGLGSKYEAAYAELEAEYRSPTRCKS